MSFEVIIERLSPTLKRITRRLNGYHSFFDDDDLYQEALTHLWSSYREGSIEDKTDSYILQGCYYHLKNYLRKTHESVSFLSLSDPIGEDGKRLEETLSHEGTTPFDYLEGRLQTEAVINKSGLTAREKDVLTLLMDGMTVREIGSRMRISHVMVVKIKHKISLKYAKFSALPSN